MKKWSIILVLFSIIFACKKDVKVIDSDSYSYDPTPYVLKLPQGFGWKPFPIPANNPLTIAGVER